jgi:hypothetical protein
MSNKPLRSQDDHFKPKLIKHSHLSLNQFCLKFKLSLGIKHWHLSFYRLQIYVIKVYYSIPMWFCSCTLGFGFMVLTPLSTIFQLHLDSLLIHTTGSTWYKVLYQYTMNVMGNGHVSGYSRAERLETKGVLYRRTK